MEISTATQTSPPLEQVNVRVLPDGRMTREDAAAYLGLKTKTLAMWHSLGKGPRCVKVGGRAFYYKDVLDEFIGGAETASPTLREAR